MLYSRVAIFWTLGFLVWLHLNHTPSLSPTSITIPSLQKFSSTKPPLLENLFPLPTSSPKEEKSISQRTYAPFGLTLPDVWDRAATTLVVHLPIKKQFLQTEPRFPLVPLPAANSFLALIGSSPFCARAGNGCVVVFLDRQRQSCSVGKDQFFQNDFSQWEI